MEVPNNDVSCYSTSLIIRYAKEKGISVDKLFDGISVPREILENPMEWTDSFTWIKLYNNLEKVFNNKPGILTDIGKEVMQNEVKSFQLFFVKIAPLSIIANSIRQHFQKSINKNLDVQITNLRDEQFDIFYRPIDRSRYASQMCDFNKGCTLATIKLKGYKNLTLTEISCAARDKNATACHYRLTWTPRPSLIHKIKNFFFFRFRDQKAIINHMEESHKNLQEQYKEILSLKDFYSHIMNNMTEGILWLDKEGKVTFANKGFFAISGYKQKELQGKCFWDFFSDEKSYSEYQGIFMDSRAMPHIPETREFTIVTKNGEKRIGRTSFMWVTSEHREPGFLISIRDITDQKKVEQKLFASESRYRSLYKNSPAIIIGLDPEGNFIYANPAMEEQSGYTEEELKKMHFGELVAPDADFDVQRLFKGRLDQGDTSLSEVHYKTKSGEWKAIALNTYPVYDDSNILAGVAGIGVDITETKRLNEQLIQTQRMDMLGKMAGGLAHDFNNILSIIIGYCGIILNKTSNDTIKKYVDNIEKATKRAVALTSNLLTFSRGEIVKKEIFDLNELLKEVQSLVIPVMPPNIETYSEIPEKHYYLKGDSGKVHQCILNLCLNAKDAIGKKSGSITIRLVDSQKEGFIVIEVEDTGPGIPPDIIDRIFDPFFSTKEKLKGTGLGLSVVYGIVRLHKGEITLDSRPGEGTTFRIELPVVHEKKKEAKEEKKIISGDITDKSGVIMIVDDDELIQAFCKEALQNQGYSTVQFSNSEKALKWFEENSKDVLVALSDIVIPQMDGIEMVKHLRKVKKDLKVVWMSAYLSPDKKRPSQHDPLLKKPFTHADLVKSIDSTLHM